MDTRFLETLVAIVELGSIAEASRRLGLTPAALSQRIKALEKDIGVPLLARSGRVVQATAAGAAILARSRELIRDARELRSLASGGKIAGELRLGAISSAMTGLAPPLIRAMTERSAHVEFYLRPGFSGELFDAVVSDRLDAAIIARPSFAMPKSCDFRVLREERLILVAPRALAEGNPHDILRTEPYVRYDSAQWGSRPSEDYLRRQGIATNDRFELDSLEAIVLMVNSGLGVSLIPEWAPPWPEGLDLVRMPLPAPAQPRQIVLVWTRADARRRLVGLLLEAVRDVGLGEPAKDR